MRRAAAVGAGESEPRVVEIDVDVVRSEITAHEESESGVGDAASKPPSCRGGGELVGQLDSPVCAKEAMVGEAPLRAECHVRHADRGGTTSVREIQESIGGQPQLEVLFQAQLEESRGTKSPASRPQEGLLQTPLDLSDARLRGKRGRGEGWAVGVHNDR